LPISVAQVHATQADGADLEGAECGGFHGDRMAGEGLD